jgi:hypothetical protein
MRLRCVISHPRRSRLRQDRYSERWSPRSIPPTNLRTPGGSFATSPSRQRQQESQGRPPRQLHERCCRRCSCPVDVSFPGSWHVPIDVLSPDGGRVGARCGYGVGPLAAGLSVIDPRLRALPFLEPMLATAGRPGSDAAERWSFEIKWDGRRALVYIDGGLRVRTRTGRQVSDALPESTIAWSS